MVFTYVDFRSTGTAHTVSRAEMQNERIGLRRKLLGANEIGVEEGLEVSESAEPFVATSVGVPAIPVVGLAEGLVFLNRHGMRCTRVGMGGCDKIAIYCNR